VKQADDKLGSGHPKCQVTRKRYILHLDYSSHLDKDTWEQVIHVAGAARIDSAAKDVAEQQHEHYWLKRYGEELIHVLYDMHHAAFDEDKRIADRPVC
jgi:hypothetical protein